MSETPEFSYPVDVASLPGTGIERPLRPTADELAAVAKRLDLQAIERMDIKIRVTPWRSFGAKLHGTFSADVIQTCVVSLEPVSAHVEDAFDVRYLPARMIEEDAAKGEVLSDPSSDEDAPEALGGDTGSLLDAGEAVVQYLSLALDPYPRHRDARLPDEATLPDEPSPFAVLAALKQKEKDK